MKGKVSAILFFSMAACSTPGAETVSSAVANPASDLPPNAIHEKFTDNPEMEWITVNDDQQNPILQGLLVSGQKEGSWTEYNSNGSVRSVTPFVHGKKEGVFLEMNNTGQFIKRIAFHNNVRHGAYVEYNYPNKKEERVYQNGKLEGQVKIYYPDGKIMELGSYKNDTRDGVSKWYDNAGNVKIEYEYKNGELVKK